MAKKRPPVTEEELEREEFLASRIAQGDQEALSELVMANREHLLPVARGYRGFRLSNDELDQAVMIGLRAAAEKFPKKRKEGVPFRVFAYRAVKWTIQGVLSKEPSGIVRLPHGDRKLGRRMRVVEKLLAQRNGRSPLQAEVAAELGLEVEQIYDIPGAFQSASSLDAPLTSDSDDSLLAVFPDEKQSMPDYEVIKQDLRVEIERALQQLPPRQAGVLSLYFELVDEEVGLNQESKFEDIAVRLGLSIPQIKRAYDAGLYNLRAIASDSLRPYLKD